MEEETPDKKFKKRILSIREKAEIDYKDYVELIEDVDNGIEFELIELKLKQYHKPALDWSTIMLKRNKFSGMRDDTFWTDSYLEEILEDLENRKINIYHKYDDKLKRIL